MSAPTNIEDAKAVASACSAVTEGARETLEQARSEVERRERARVQAAAALNEAEVAFDARADAGEALDRLTRARATHDSAERLLLAAREGLTRTEHAHRVAADALARASRDVRIAELSAATAVETLRESIDPHSRRLLELFDALVVETSAIESAWRASAAAARGLRDLGVPTPDPDPLHTIVAVLAGLVPRGLALREGLAPIRAELTVALEPTRHLSAGAIVNALDRAMREGEGQPGYVATNTAQLVTAMANNRTFADAMTKVNAARAATAVQGKPYQPNPRTQWTGRLDGSSSPPPPMRNPRARIQPLDRPGPDDALRSAARRAGDDDAPPGDPWGRRR